MTMNRLLLFTAHKFIASYYSMGLLPYLFLYNTKWHFFDVVLKFYTLRQIDCLYIINGNRRFFIPISDIISDRTERDADGQSLLSIFY